MSIGIILAYKGNIFNGENDKFPKFTRALAADCLTG
jgi:hypothetical protein